MCVMSMVYDYYQDKWKQPLQYPIYPTWIIPSSLPPQLTPEELAEFRKLLERAKKYDEENNQKDCELEEKKKKLRELAAELGAKVDFL
jgi:hypothetical protein